MTLFIALLRGINVGGHNKIAMTELRRLCEELGFGSVQSYIQSGNLVFSAPGGAPAIEAELERTIAKQLGLTIDLIVRPAAGWQELAQGCPFPEAEAEPNRVMLGLSKRPPRPDAVAALRERAQADERIEGAREALWFYFGSGAGRSKLTPAVLDRLVGSPVTLRNLRTVQKLAQMASAMATAS